MSKTMILTIVGCVMAALTAIADYLAHANMDGGAFKQPTFWIAIAVAAGMGIKGYLAQATPPAGEVVVTKPAPPAA
jgi:hypothetical protein